MFYKDHTELCNQMQLTEHHTEALSIKIKCSHLSCMSGCDIDTDIRDSPDSGGLKVLLVHPPARSEFER